MSNTELDTELIPDITELMAELGKDAVFSIPASKSYNPRDGETDEGSITSTTWTVTPPVQTNMYIDNDLKQGRLWRTFIGAEDITFTPTKGYDLTLDSVVWQIHAANPIYSGNLIAGYILMLRA